MIDRNRVSGKGVAPSRAGGWSAVVGDWAGSDVAEVAAWMSFAAKHRTLTEGGDADRETHE
jgi:hypothetical protein